MFEDGHTQRVSIFAIICLQEALHHHEFAMEYLALRWQTKFGIMSRWSAMKCLAPMNADSLHSPLHFLCLWFIVQIWSNDVIIIMSIWNSNQDNCSEQLQATWAIWSSSSMILLNPTYDSISIRKNIRQFSYVMSQFPIGLYDWDILSEYLIVRPFTATQGFSQSNNRTNLNNHWPPIVEIWERTKNCPLNSSFHLWAFFSIGGQQFLRLLYIN